MWCYLRLRASLFVNLVAMRSSMSRDRNAGPVLDVENRSVLTRSIFLLHSAHNCLLAAWVDQKNNYTNDHLFGLVWIMLNRNLRFGTWGHWEWDHVIQDQAKIPPVAGILHICLSSQIVHLYVCLCGPLSMTSKAWPFGHRPIPLLQSAAGIDVWWWGFCW